MTTTTTMPDPVRLSSAPVRTIRGHGHALTASFWSPVGDPTIAVSVRTWGVGDDTFAAGQTIDDTDGNPYTIIDVRYTGDGAFREAHLTAARPDVIDAYDAGRAADAEADAIARDPRVPTVKALIRQAVDQTAGGWYSDVYADSDGNLQVGVPTSTGFQTHPRQDGKHVVARIIGGNVDGRDGRTIHALALSAVGALRQG